MRSPSTRRQVCGWARRIRAKTARPSGPEHAGGTGAARALRSDTRVTDMDVLTLPLDYSAIERILPHRYPFLLVDRITEFEPDRRIVGVKNVSLNEPYLARPATGRPSMPPTILTEAVAQVGAILILAKPENKHQLIF